jgi:tetratricopeptide (TPR) repeat protein
MKFSLIILMLFVSSLVYGQSDPVTVATEADAAYDNHDYVTAIRLYQSLINDDVRDSSVFFNLGNAYFQSGDLGRALVNYRRAQQFIPRDGDLNVNMARIRAARVDIQSDETGLLGGMAALTVSILTLMEFGWLIWLLWTLWFSLLIVYIVRKTWRNLIRTLLMLVGGLVLIGILLFGSRMLAALTEQDAVVIEKAATVMSGPGEQYLDLFQLHAAAELVVVENRGDWVRFALPDGREGWLKREAIESL